MNFDRLLGDISKDQAWDVVSAWYQLLERVKMTPEVRVIKDKRSLVVDQLIKGHLYLDGIKDLLMILEAGNVFVEICERRNHIYLIYEKDRLNRAIEEFVRGGKVFEEITLLSVESLYGSRIKRFSYRELSDKEFQLLIQRGLKRHRIEELAMGLKVDTKRILKWAEGSRTSALDKDRVEKVLKEVGISS